MARIITALAHMLSPIFDRETHLEVADRDRDDEQSRIVIGHRQLKRGEMLRAAAPVQKPQTTVQIGDCGNCTDCGVPNKIQNGVVIAQCGCGVGGSRAFAAAASAGHGSGGAMVPDPMTGCYPRSICDNRTMAFKSESWGAMLRNSRMNQTPYVDPFYDSVWMDEIWSTPTTVGPGLTVNLTLAPTAGTFALFYYDILAVDTTTQVAQVDWRAARPRIESCPVPCSTGTSAALAQFVMKVPEACCGKPLVAWLDEVSRNTPLVIPFTNNQAAGDLLVQVGGRGYCCNERIC
jgi:hypothetical protein